MTATLTASRPIRQLPAELANQIAAGEVIERPASVVKELLENSLDAGASRIEIHIGKGGLQQISVRDNGCGIPKNQLSLAISRHATSKISSLDELVHIHSLGFRGEALASIGSVSRMRMISCCADSRAAWQIDCTSNDLAIQAASHPPGTSIVVEDLFYNTPARRKFMRSEKTEFRYIDEVVRRMALSHFAVGFSFKHNDRLVYQLPPGETEAARARRITRLCGKAFMEHALPVDFSAHGMRVWGWLTGPQFSRSQNDLQHFFINGRIIRDRLISHAIRQVYQDCLPPGRHAAYVLYLHIEPAAVDVNVHPTKHEVRFREARMVHDFLHRGLREALSGSGIIQPDVAKTIRPEAGQRFSYSQAVPPAATVEEPVVRNEGPLGRVKGMVRERFILAENAEGLVLVDARRAQEVLIYQKLCQAFAEGGISHRPLLIPKSVSVSVGQTSLVEHAQPVLERLGFELSCNGPQSVMLRRIPVPVAGADSELLVRGLLQEMEAMPDQTLTQEHYLHLLQHLAGIAARTQPLAAGLDELNRFLREVETLSHTCLWRCLTAQELQALIDPGRS